MKCSFIPTARVEIEFVSIVCPYCHSSLLKPEYQAEFWTPQQVRALENQEADCPHCKRTLIISSPEYLPFLWDKFPPS